MADEPTLTQAEIEAIFSTKKTTYGKADDRYTYLGGTKDSTTGFMTGPQRRVLAKPIGVPQGYRAPYRGQRYNAPVLNAGELAMDTGQPPSYIEARYDDSDLFRFASMSPEAIAQLQGALMQAGLLDEFRRGVWDKGTASAMEQILGHANQAGLEWQDALDAFLNGEAEKVSLKGSSGPVFVARLQNPDDVKKALTQGLYNALGGRYIDDTQLQQMVDAYQAQDVASQQRAFYAAQSGGTVEQAPRPDTFAEEQAKQTDAQGYKAKKFADFASVLEQLIA